MSPKSADALVFAVIGRVNEGKSSIVAALTEDESIAIGPEPGTTRKAARYQISCDGEALVTIVDTPGFQEPEAAFAWLAAKASTAAERAPAVAAFLRTFSGTGTFEDECRLLQPIMDGASVLYVVDCSHPYRASYDFEMQILRWTGQPCFALINQTGSADHSQEWKAALKQYFNAVRTFNAQKSLFEDRIGLLTMLSELDEGARPHLVRAVQLLRRRQDGRYEQAAGAIADALVDLVGLRVSEPTRGDALSEADKTQLEERFHREVQKREAEARRSVELALNYRRLQTLEPELGRALFDRDIFSEETWQLLGQSPLALIAAGTLGGALVGGTIDAMTLGHSFLAGTFIGAGLGGIGSAFAVLKAPEARLLGVAISGSEMSVGPHRNPNFAWIVLDRALLHLRALLMRTHAAPSEVRLEASKADSPERRGLVSGLSKTQTARLEMIFQTLRQGKPLKSEARQRLRQILLEVARQLAPGAF